jgi:putative two-component system response regulator
VLEESMDSQQDNVEKPTILIVDDTPENITVLSALLKDRYRTKVATNGFKAIDIASTTPPPDLILLDIMMPEMDGYEACRRLRQNPITSDIPVIFLTARSQVGDEELGLKVGAVDYITKPISPPVVLARVKTHLALKSARQFLSVTFRVIIFQHVAGRCSKPVTCCEA